MTTRPDDGTDADAANVSAALAAVVSGLGELAEVASWRCSDAELQAALAGLEELSRRAEGQRLRLVAEAGSRGLPERAGYGRLAHWMRAVCPTISPRAAAGHARRAERLFTSAVAAELAPTRAAVLAGALTADQTDVVINTVEALTPPTCPAETIDAQTLDEAQGFLLEQAAVFDAPRLRRLAGSLRDRLDPDAEDRLAKDEAARDRARCLTISTQTSGMVYLNGLLTPECGAALTTAIDAWSAPRPAVDGTPDPRTGAQRRHDALHQLASTAITTPGRLPTSHGSPYRIIVRVPLETLTAALQPDHPDATAPAAVGAQPATLPDGTPLSTATLATLACNAEIVPVLTDPDGNPLDVGDTQYAFPAKQRTAIIDRDQHCSYPHCQAPPSWCDVHHIDPARCGGPTAVTNGTLLCGRHHRHVHHLHQHARLIDGQITWDHLTADPLPATPGPHTNRAHRALDHLIRRWQHRRRLHLRC
jgi:hypothetical protein